jgi:hypothetical protein
MNDDSTGDDSTKKPSNAVRRYEVGYCKPPMHTRFQKGVSGNPRGGSRKAKQRRARGLAIKEAYRVVTVRDGGKTLRLPAIQAVMRSQVTLAAKGNGPAQRALIAAVHALEEEIAAAYDQGMKAQAAQSTYTRWEAARRIAFLMREAITERGTPPPADLMDQIDFLMGEQREMKEETADGSSAIVKRAIRPRKE